MAGEVEKLQKTFHIALLFVVILNCAVYIVLLMVVSGVGNLDQMQWESGYMWRFLAFDNFDQMHWESGYMADAAR